MDGFLIAFAVSFGVIFVAELGDKSQLMALTFATRYRAVPVLVGITLATAVVHAISVAVGYGLGTALPTGWIALAAAVAFLGFGAWTLRGDRLTPEERAKAERSSRSAVGAASVAFFLAELGDKTMLATITLATQHGWVGVWLGSTLGMVVADGLAIAVGRQLGRRLPERAVKSGAAMLFFLFGAWLAVDATGQLTGAQPWAAVAAVLDHHAAAWVALVLGLAVIVAGTLGRRRVPRREQAAVTRGPGVLWSRALFLTAVVLGLVAPVLVGADLVQPFALFVDPGVVVVGAGVVLLGATLLLGAQGATAALRQAGADKVSATQGLYARVRHPGLAGAVVAMAGVLIMAPTVLGVLATVLLVVAVQIQVHAVREPRLARVHGTVYAGYARRTGLFLPRVLPPGQPAADAGLPDSGRVRVG